MSVRWREKAVVPLSDRRSLLSCLKFHVQEKNSMFKKKENKSWIPRATVPRRQQSAACPNYSTITGTGLTGCNCNNIAGAIRRSDFP
jgi:hypothetical protein